MTYQSHAIVHPDGVLEYRGEMFRAALGRGGVRLAKREGDGATPAGLLPLRRVYYRADRLTAPECALPVEAIARDSGWCDDPSRAGYNRFVQLPHPASCESLWREAAVYDIVAVLGWNDCPVVPGRGSAIFLHAARPDFAPTEGCVALALEDLRRVMKMGLTALDIRPPPDLSAR